MMVCCDDGVDVGCGYLVGCGFFVAVVYEIDLCVLVMRSETSN